MVLSECPQLIGWVALFTMIIILVDLLRRSRKRVHFFKQLAALTTRVLGDYLPEEIDAIYLYSQTPDNCDCQVEKLKRLLTRYPSAKVLVCGEDGSRRCGWEGHARFKESLLGNGISSQRIITVPFPSAETMIHTLNESKSLVSYLRTSEHQKILLVSPSFHQVRCFVSFTSCLREQRCSGQIRARHLNIEVYNSPAHVKSWQEQACHSQGLLRGPRAKFVHSEIDRLWKYYCKGDLLHPQQVLEALTRRTRA
jgi:hypothetical protein